MRTLIKLLWNGIEVPFSNISVSLNEKLTSNKMDVTIENIDEIISDGVIKFNIGDTFELFAKNDYDGTELDTSATSPDLLFSGILKEISLTKGTKFKVTLSFVDYSYDILNRIWSKNYEDKTAPEIIYNILDNVSYTASAINIISFPLDSTSPYTSGIQNKRPDGSDFPLMSYGNAHKPVFEFLNDLSQVGYTNSITEQTNGTIICKRPFKYYIDRQNIFHWFYPTDTPNHYLSFGATGAIGTDTKYHRILSDNLKLSQFGEINFIIYKAGEDMNNNQVLYYSLDPTAESLTTADTFRNWEDIARSMKLADLQAGNITHTKSDEYNYPASYPVTPAWNKNITVNLDSEYNLGFIKEAERRANQRCNDLFNLTGDPRWKGTITLKGEAFNPTDLVQYTHSEYGLIKKNLRIKKVTHQLRKDSFTTTLDVEEDVPEVEL